MLDQVSIKETFICDGKCPMIAGEVLNDVFSNGVKYLGSWSFHS